MQPGGMRGHETTAIPPFRSPRARVDNLEEVHSYLRSTVTGNDMILKQQQDFTILRHHHCFESNDSEGRWPPTSSRL